MLSVAVQCSCTPKAADGCRWRPMIRTGPCAYTRIFFAAEQDRRVLRNGLQLVREIMQQPPLDDFRGPEFAPGEEVRDDIGLDAHINRSAITVHHPLGTCRMGSDVEAVVDTELKVRGTEGLRVVDASVMPDMVSGNINAAVVMIAEKASDMIQRRNPLPSEKPKVRT